VLRPASVVSADAALRMFASLIAQAHPEVTAVAALERVHLEGYKRWLAARPNVREGSVSVATRAHRLGMLRMFFLRAIAWAGPTRRCLQRDAIRTGIVGLWLPAG
jgi:hypothetical protein